MDERPNILLICTDQQRYDALGCYGNPRIQTPAIDGLAGEGVLFEQCLCKVRSAPRRGRA